jgi:uncharacterized protein YbjT (DUF2867 family)
VKRILVTGASGNIGGEVVSQLLASGIGVRAMMRQPEHAGLPDAVEVVRGDFAVPSTLDQCLDGVDAVFLVWLAPAEYVEPALERIARQARKIVYLSAPIHTPHPFFQQPNPVRNVMAQIERLIGGSGLAWTFVRPHMFAGNALYWWGPQIRSGDIVRWPYLAAPTAPVDERDIATVAVRALTEEGQGGVDYVVTGPESLTQLQQIEIVGQAMGRSLRVEELSPEEWRQEAAGTWSAPIVKMLLDAWAAAIGQPAYVTSTVAEVTGTPARTFLQWAGDHVAEFLSE